MFAEERKSKITEMIKNGKSVRVSELAKQFGVSESTIRRDLADLETIGMIKRTHGGAVDNFVTSFEPSFAEKEDKYAKEKEHIGKLAASFIKDGDTIILDSGTTTKYIVPNITAKNVTIITNSLNIAYELSNNSNFEVIVTGGLLRTRTQALVGDIAQGTLRQFRVDKAFIGANGVSLRFGVTTPNVIEAATKRAMMENAKEIFLVIDSSKFDQVSFSLICPVNTIDYIVTDRIEESERVQYEKIGVRIIT
ncbi:MAG TPA: DeoR/GlpR family DNA-binding transcription regulator [Fervidobacterium sp.]|jgi:DeoR family fructose operon transcriptional repressor|nr:DeoR/GlpR transcriptional regulator [Fervidobacterium sp.]NLH38020.1 DeoR/GlpR transcriptional regulator [Thermotogaceae bacterium]MBP8657631.1 DeoR/GlpR transcriptional regulator [Fervidobacterium sp.]MBP9518701.1 DeoR/GlpR transcriptional regulator [Fervidobacterium sp.]HCL98290.1 DeoR family transcriptional regulator [Fervidobacterium sp.]